MQRGLLVRLRLTIRRDLAYLLRFCDPGNRIEAFGESRGYLWSIQESFEQASQVAGLDE